MIFYVASSNPGKLRDFALAAEDCLAAPGTALAGRDAILIQPLPGLAGIAAPPEDELTFEGNASAKAEYYSRLPAARDLLVLADDSGLEVAGLDGAPGVRSARFAEDVGFPAAPASTLDERNNAALLRALDGIPEACRQARYRCVLALARNGTVETTAEGDLDGRILTVPRGSGGFGYDPLFLVHGHNQTMAELDPLARLGLSHRGRALRMLLETWPCKNP
jgi:XTP/dITP diphosphohydrolase